MPDGSRPDPAGYETDYYLWSQRQAALLRAMGASGSNEEVDWENVAEEIESLGRSDKRAIGSRLETILEHLLKLRYSTASDPRRGWINTVRRERILVDKLLRDSPSLRPQIASLLADHAGLARDAAAASLSEHGEGAAASAVERDADASWVERVLDETFIPHPVESATST